MRAETLSAFERHLVAAAARPQTITTYARIARAFLRSLNDRDADQAVHADVEAFLARPRRTGVPASTSTRNLELVALRALFRARGGADPTDGFALKRPDHRQPDVPTTTELATLFQAATRKPARERALAALALLFQAGLRVHELVALDVEQVDLGAGVLLAVAGKNATRYEIPLGPEAVALVGEWIALHPIGSGPLFPSTSRRAARASVRSIQRLLARLRRETGLAKHITPHSLRHATATEAIGRGVSLPATAALMRHARVETTMLYVALVSTARREAATCIGGAIPRNVLPISQNHSENPPFCGVHDAVDADDDLCDSPSPEYQGGLSRNTRPINTPPQGARFDPGPPRAAPLLADGGSRGHDGIEKLLAEHLAAVATLVDASLGACAREPRVGLPADFRVHRMRRWRCASSRDRRGRR